MGEYSKSARKYYYLVVGTMNSIEKKTEMLFKMIGCLSYGH